MNKMNKMNMEIRISNLNDGNHSFSFETDPIDFEIKDVDFSNPVKTLVEIDKSGSQYNLKANITGKYIMNCERCLDKYEQTFDINFELIYKIDFKGDFINNEFDEDSNLIFISPNTHHIDIKNDVRDFLILNIPMRKIPDEHDGKCVYCEKEINNEYKSVKKK